MRIRIAALGTVFLVCSLPLLAANVTVYYGDDDGFGVAQTSGTLSDPTTSHQGVGEAPYTDDRLIGTAYAYPPFAPTSSLSFSIPSGDTIVSATLTLRTGSFSPISPVDGTNQIVLDGITLDPSFINGFTSASSDQIETRTVSLPPAILAALADGSVSLNGTHISEGDGYGSFQVDFLRIDIVTASPVAAEPIPAVSWPALAAMALALAAAALVAFRR